MTAQIADALWFEGRHFRLSEEPLGSWLGRRKNRHIRFLRGNTACSRGYTAAWAIYRGRLYMTHFQASLPDGSPVTMDTLFGNYTDAFYESARAYAPENEGPGVYAFWFTGALVCPFGARLLYQHYGYGSVYEYELCLNIQDGFLLGSRIVDYTALPERSARIARRAHARSPDADLWTLDDYEALVWKRQLQKHRERIGWL